MTIQKPRLPSERRGTSTVEKKAAGSGWRSLALANAMRREYRGPGAETRCGTPSPARASFPRMVEPAPRSGGPRKRTAKQLPRAAIGEIFRRFAAAEPNPKGELE